jgi:hypothetical protein
MAVVWRFADLRLPDGLRLLWPDSCRMPDSGDRLIGQTGHMACLMSGQIRDNHRNWVSKMTNAPDRQHQQLAG